MNINIFKKIFNRDNAETIKKYWAINRSFKCIDIIAPSIKTEKRKEFGSFFKNCLAIRRKRKVIKNENISEFKLIN